MGSSAPGSKGQLVLPKTLSVQNVPALFEEIKEKNEAGSLDIDFGPVEEFDSSALAFMSLLKTHFPGVTFKNIKEDLARAFERSVAKRQSPAEEYFRTPPPARLESLANRFLRVERNIVRFFTLLSDELYHAIHYLRKGGGIYPGEVWNQLYFMAYRSYPIVCLITFLVGVTISLTSAAQLKLFGADIYLAYFIGIAMIRELVPLMTGIILAGKIGASITAEISTMNVLEEIDALKTMGIVPERFLMVPRLLAITLAIPLLVALADFVGIFGGVLVARMALGTPPASFLKEMMTVVFLKDFLIGLVKTMVFGWAIVVSSGFKGFFVQRSAEEVGRATTESVVLSISLIILLDCIFAFIFY